MDDLNVLLEGLNLRSYSSEVNFQRVVVHFGTEMKMIETHSHPYEKLKNYLNNPEFKNIHFNKLIYIMDIKETYPIDLDL